MERYSNSIREVGQNSRRGALLLSIDVHHPQVLDFIKAKSDLKKVTGANISVKLSDEFIGAVINGGDYEQRFPVDNDNPQFSKLVSANEIFNVIVEQAWKTAEPGLLMWFNVKKYTPADCYERFASAGTNPCSELVLSPLDSCRLLCLNLLSYISKPFTKETKFHTNLFETHSKIAQRLMDDVIDLESECIDRIIKKILDDPEPQYTKQREIDMWHKIKSNNDDGRRTGTGITALGDALAALGITYGSKKSIEITEKIYRQLKLECYRSSVHMAKILGPFKGWNPKLEKNHEFLLRIKEEDPTLYQEMNKYGRRNVSLTTTAPTGSVSLLTCTSSGIEPVFKLSHTRRRKISDTDTNVTVNFIDETGDKWQEFEVFHPTFEKWKVITGKSKKEDSPWHGSCSHEIDWSNRIKLQTVAQKHICHGISSTLNLPKDISIEDVKKIYLQAAKNGLKGVTIYREGSRSGVLINKNSNNEYERPKELDCDVYVISRDKTPFFILIGKLNGIPFEIFAGNNFNNTIDKKIEQGKIIKSARGKYKFVNGSTELSPISAFTDPDIDCITRLVSTSLRHKVPIEFICSQLDKSGGHLHSVHKAIVRALKSYIKDGTKMGEQCPECSNDVWYKEGCKTCTCGWSKC
jgi:ribonucleoside-diphosphate reductase alpha chain